MTKADLHAELSLVIRDVTNSERVETLLSDIIDFLPAGGNQSIIQVGSIDSVDLNAGAALLTFTKVFAGAIPADKYYIGYGFTVTETTVLSATAVDVTDVQSIISSHAVASISTAGDIGQNGAFFGNSSIKGVTSDVTVILNLSAANANDFTQGKINIFAIVSDYPY